MVMFLREFNLHPTGQQLSWLGRLLVPLGKCQDYELKYSLATTLHTLTNTSFLFTPQYVIYCSKSLVILRINSKAYLSRRNCKTVTDQGLPTAWHSTDQRRKNVELVCFDFHICSAQVAFMSSI